MQTDSGQNTENADMVGSLPVAAKIKNKNQRIFVGKRTYLHLVVTDLHWYSNLLILH